MLLLLFLLIAFHPSPLSDLCEKHKHFSRRGAEAQGKKPTKDAVRGQVLQCNIFPPDEPASRL